MEIARVSLKYALYVFLVIFMIIVPPLFSAIGYTWPVVVISYGMAFAIGGLGFNLLLGYTGLLSFGHAAFFGGGAYIAALYFKYMRPVPYGKPQPLFVTSLEVWLLLAIVGIAIISMIFGAICVRHTEVYFAVLALALSMVLWGLAFRLYWYTGGGEGMRVPTPSLLGIDYHDAVEISRTMTKLEFFVGPYYYYELFIFLICIAVMWVIVKSPFGKTLQSIRANATRAEFVGIRVRMYRWIAFVLSGIFASIGGVLWAPINGQCTPDVLYWFTSGIFVFLTIVGGYRMFAGPLVGGILYEFLEIYARGHFHEIWQIILGGILVVFVLFLPKGITGGLVSLYERIKVGRMRSGGLA
ncbi:MAG: branched-chain amino acid ABC transporter permease [Candidatus Geothermarchaeales archaeon]